VSTVADLGFFNGGDKCRKHEDRGAVGAKGVRRERGLWMGQNFFEFGTLK